ncbi:MAG: alpha/beta hydrolase [Novosphingobium sp.]
MTLAKPAFAEDGTVSVPAFKLPPSSFSSPEAQAAQARRALVPGGAPPIDMPIEAIRQGLEQMLAPQVEAMRKVYPVNITEDEIAGIPVRVITPAARTELPGKILLNLHGGAFTMCADACALLESVPIAALGGYRIVTVDYRMAPEAQHPAALEDIEAVYRKLLETYAPQSMAIYGCSAGGALTAQMAVWLPMRGLPQPAAVGIFGAGGVRFMHGDSAYIAGYVDGSFPPPPLPGESASDMTRGYFHGFDMDDPVISPALHPEVIAKFPPTLLITGTRAMDMTPAIITNSALLKAGVSSTLIVGEAMGHCFIYAPEIPESLDAHQAIVDFFGKHVK